MATINNVTVVFQPDGASVADAVSAANQHVYIDLTAGTMSYCRTNASGKLVGSNGSSAVSLDDSRSYRVVVSPTALPTPPGETAGTSVRITGGKLAVVPHIAIKVVDGSTPLGNLACTLGVGASNTNVTTTRAGWIISNDQSSGAVTLSSATKLLKAAAATTPQATLTVSPSPAVRDSSVTITVGPPSGAVGFKVTEWKCQLSFTNPGNPTPVSATITRPASESPATFSQNWQGDVCAPSTARVKFVVGATVRASGNAAVSATLSAQDPEEVTAPVAVTDRTGATWQTTLTENAEGDLVRAINSFRDTGEHGWTSSFTAPTTKTISSGPHKGCVYVSAVSCTFVSTPKINTLLKNAASAFSLAQNAAYLVSPAPVRVIPSNLYTVGAGGAITETSPGAIATHFGLTGGGSTSAHCIDQASLLAGTRRHEHADAGGLSHKGNCLKALRALDPVAFAEALVKVPGASLNFATAFSNRVTLVANAGPTHDIIDEAQTQADHVLRFVAGQEILGVNMDNTGALIGPVWNPTTNRMLGN